MLIHRNIAKGIIGFASTDCFRYQLNGAFLERSADGSAHATATDGHILCTVAWKDNPDEFPSIDGFPGPGTNNVPWEKIIPSLVLKDLSGSIKLPKRNSKPILENIAIDEISEKDGKIMAAVTDLANPTIRNVSPIDGFYPRYRNALPDHEGKPIYRYNISTLIQALEAVQTMAGKEKTIQMTFGDPDRPMAIHAEGPNGELIHAMVMPMIDWNDDLHRRAAALEAEAAAAAQSAELAAGHLAEGIAATTMEGGIA